MMLEMRSLSGVCYSCSSGILFFPVASSGSSHGALPLPFGVSGSTKTFKIARSHQENRCVTPRHPSSLSVSYSGDFFCLRLCRAPRELRIPTPLQTHRFRTRCSDRKPLPLLACQAALKLRTNVPEARTVSGSNLTCPE